MAKDYKFVMHCWQDKYGSDNATANIFVNDTQVATNVEITATSADSVQIVTFEATGLADPNNDTRPTADIKIVLTNEAYVDADNDRNIWISGLYQFYKDPADWSGKTDEDANFKFLSEASNSAGNKTWAHWEVLTDEKIADGTALWSKLDNIPTNVQGSQISSSWWSDNNDNKWIFIPVWGDSDNTGTTITLPLIG